MTSAVHSLVMRSAAFAAAALTAASALAAPYEIGDDMQNASFWTSDPVLFASRHRDSGFALTSEQRDGAASRLDGGVECFGLPVYESRLAFGPKGGVERVELMLYARGGTEAMREFTGTDGRKFLRRERIDRPMTREEFGRALAVVRGRLTSPGAKAPQTRKETAGAILRSYFFNTPASKKPKASPQWEAFWTAGDFRLLLFQKLSRALFGECGFVSVSYS